MTIREALMQAHKELGTDAKDVEDALRFADAHAPSSSKTVNKDLEPGEEKKMVEYFKTAWLKIRANPQLQAEILAFGEQHIKGTQRNQ